MVASGITPSRTTNALSRFARRSWPDLLGTLGAILIGIVLGWHLLGSNVTVPEDIVAQIQPFSAFAPQPVKNWIVSDVVLAIYPNRVFVQHAFAASQFPLWNPLILTGQPTVPDPVMAMFYPTTHLFSHLSAAQARDNEMLLHLIIAALGTYVAVRVLGGTPLGGVAAAACFAGCNILTVWQQYGNIITCAAWLPWVFICLTMLHRRKHRLLWIGAGALALGLVILANDVQWLLYDLLLLIPYIVLMSMTVPREDANRRTRFPHIDFSMLLDSAATLILGFLVGAVQFLPEFILAINNPRLHHQTYAQVLAHASAPEWLLTLFAPNFYGMPTVRGSEWYLSSNYPSSVIYWGFLPALIALTAPIWRRTPLIWFLWISLIGLVSASYGAPTLHLYALLPGYNALEAARLTYLACFIGALLTGVLFHELFAQRRWWLPVVVLGGLAIGARGVLHLALTHMHPQPLYTLDPTRESLHWATILVIAGIALLTIGAIRYAPVRKSAAIGLAILIVVDMARFALPYNAATFPESAVYPRPQVLDAIPQGVVPPRLVPIQAKDSLTLLPPNTFEPFGIADLTSDESLTLPDYDSFHRLIEPTPFKYNQQIRLFTDYASPLLDLAGVDYFISATPLDTTRKRLALVSTADGVFLYRNMQAAPRAFIVTNVRSATTSTAVASLLTSPEYTPCAYGIVEGQIPFATRSDAGAPLGGTSDGCVGTATITRYEPNRVYLHADTPAEGMLVLSDAYDPDWQVTVDGVRQPVLKADGPFRGVHLLPGSHDVRFEYRPTLVYVTGATSAIAALASIGLIVVGFRRRKPRVSPEPELGGDTEKAASHQR